jgi:hypothetical protein
MALLKRADRLDGIPIAPDILEAIVDRLRLVEIAPLRRYEQTAPPKVAEILRSLRSTGVLINPVVVDPKLGLLVDGHHRVQAFRILGIPLIPAFTVDYLATDLVVKGWNHTADPQPDDLNRSLEELGGPDEGPSEMIVADSHRRTLWSSGFPNSLDSAKSQDRWIHRVEEQGYPVELQAEADPLQLSLVHSYIRPVVSKQDVLDMVERGTLFPREINRHVVQDRPLNLRIPLETTGDARRFSRHLDQACHTAPPLAVKPGSEQQGRLYDERVTFFHADRANP